MGWSPPERAPRCPGCGRLDQVQRVSAVCRAGSATTRGVVRSKGSFWGLGRGGAMWGSIRATTVSEEAHASELSAVLAPPAAPTYHNRWGLVSTIVVITILLSGWMALAEAPGLHCATGDQRTVCWDGRGSMFVESAIGTTPDPGTFARLVQVGLVALPVTLLTGLLALRWRLGVRRRRRFKADYHAWQELRTSWASLRYCHRCDGVFAPGERQLQAPSDWTALCPEFAAV